MKSLRTSSVRFAALLAIVLAVFPEPAQALTDYGTIANLPTRTEANSSAGSRSSFNPDNSISNESTISHPGGSLSTTSENAEGANTTVSIQVAEAPEIGVFASSSSVGGIVGQEGNNAGYSSGSASDATGFLHYRFIPTSDTLAPGTRVEATFTFGLITGFSGFTNYTPTQTESNSGLNLRGDGFYAVNFLAFPDAQSDRAEAFEVDILGGTTQPTPSVTFRGLTTNPNDGRRTITNLNTTQFTHVVGDQEFVRSKSNRQVDGSVRNVQFVIGQPAAIYAEFAVSSVGGASLSTTVDGGLYAAGGHVDLNANFFLTPELSGVTFIPIPEPSTILLVAFALVGSLVLRRRALAR